MRTRADTSSSGSRSGREIAVACGARRAANRCCSSIVTVLRERAQSMVERVAQEARQVLSAADTAAVRAAVQAALLVRDRVFEDDHDPRLLAPARVVRILIADARVANPAVLCAAAFIDSVDPELVADVALLDAAAAQLHGQVPRPDDGADDLLERLVIAPVEALLIAVAERLDQARHLHLRPELPWRAFHAEIRTAWIPAARRADALLARRLERWADAFERRLLLSD